MLRNTYWNMDEMALSVVCYDTAQFAIKGRSCSVKYHEELSCFFLCLVKTSLWQGEGSRHSCIYISSSVQFN